MQPPTQVNRAIVLLWLAFAIGGLAVALSFDEASQLSFATELGIAVVILFAVNALLIWLIGRRHNWARIALLVFILVTLPFVLLGELPDGALAWVAAGAEWVSTILEVIALYYLMTGVGAAWFRTAAEEAPVAR